MSENRAAGTVYSNSVAAQRDGSLTVYSDLNWRVAKSHQNQAAVTEEVNSHVRSYRVAETDKNGTIRVALNKFKKEGFEGTVIDAKRELSKKLETARANERQSQRDQFHGGVRGELGMARNPHDMSQNPELSRPITGQDVERLIRTLPGGQ